MRLVGSDGTRLELIFVGYESPESENDDWLLTVIRSHSARGNCDMLEAITVPWQAEEFADWLATIAAGQASSIVPGHWASFWFLEQVVTFEDVVMQDDMLHMHIRLVTHGDSWMPSNWKPAETKEEAQLYREQMIVDDFDLVVSINEVKAAAKALRAELARFPARIIK